MKSFLSAILIVLGVALLPSCKKEVKPTLIVTVYDTLGEPMEQVNVITHPCFFNQDNCDTARLNPSFHKEHLTNSAGQSIFEFPYSSVLDVVAIDAITDSNGDTIEFYYGRTVVALETKELKKDEKNEYSISVIIDEYYQ